MATAELPPMMVAPGLLSDDIVCYPTLMVTTNGIWVGENPMLFYLTEFLYQNLIFIIIIRLLMLLLKPFNATRTVCELLCGIICGRSGIGSTNFSNIYIFQKKSLILHEVMGNIGVIYFLFMLGLEMDLSIIKKHGKKSLIFAFASMIPPLLFACIFSFPLFKLTTIRQDIFTLLFTSALSITALPVLARTLGQFRILGLEIGDLGKSTALITEIFGVALLVLAVVLADKTSSPYMTWSSIILSATTFIVLCLLVVRPMMTWLITKRKPEDDQGFKDFTIAVLIAGAILSGVVTDAVGVHPMFGAFVFGLLVPRSTISITLVEKLHDYVTGFMLPLFFITAGMKTNVAKIGGVGAWLTLIVAIALGSVGSVVGTFFAARSMDIPSSQGIALGLLMNTKGLIILLGSSYGKDQKMMDETTYSIIVMTTLLINALVTPILIRIYKPARKTVPYSCRTVQQAKRDSELRILTCLHNPRNVPTIINLLEASHPTKISPISAFSLHLIEQNTRGASLLVTHDNQMDAEESAAVARVQAQTEDILNAFDAFKMNYLGAVEVQAMTGVAGYSVMHEQICDVAEEKRVSLVIVPFHKQQTVDGAMESTNPQFRDVNRNLMGSSPCSVGILVDRGLGGTTRNNAQRSHNIGVLFFGGPDDREALSFALRMLEHPHNTLNVIRFIIGPEAIDPDMDANPVMRELGMLSVEVDRERQRELDEEFLKDLKMIKLTNESFSYTEKEVNNGDETVAFIRSVESTHDFFIVGRSQGMVSPATSGLTEWSECPELGVIGDLLASSDFATTVSALVIQQYIEPEVNEESVGRSLHHYRASMR